MFDRFKILFLTFIVYSFIGWIIETVHGLVKTHKFVNRGFLIGPVVPIWGVGAILITLFLNRHDSVFGLIISAAFIGTALEYVVSYLMEKIFKVRWWDYSDLPYNINGRVWLGSSIVFGIGGFVVMKVVDPFLINLISHFSPFWLSFVFYVLLILFVSDFITSFTIIKHLKLSPESEHRDYTAEISKKVEAVLSEDSILFKRLIKSFPNVHFSFKPKK